MDIGKAINSILRNTAGVSNYVGSRIFPQKIPFGETMPAITYDYVRCQITSFGTTYAEAQDLSAEVRNALDYKTGTVEGVEIDKCFFEDANDVYDDKFGDDGIHYVAMDFRFNINR
jgi:hypothetical protein